MSKKIRKENILNAHSPEIVQEFWEYAVNTVSPDEISIYSPQKVWWRCKKDHLYDQSPANKVVHGSRCPYCSNQRACLDNCLATTHPSILEEWSSNNTLSPLKVLAGSAKKTLWECKLHGEYEMSINKKVSGQGCAQCKYIKMVDSRRKKVPTTDSLAGEFSKEILKEWDFERNIAENVHPHNYTLGSASKVWWKCTIHGSYKQRVYSHTRGHSGCSICRKLKIGSANSYVPLEQSLAFTSPSLLTLWNKKKNDSLGIDPCHTLSSSGKKAYFKCVLHGSYKKEIRKVISDQIWECPRCAPRGSNSKPNVWIEEYLKKRGVNYEAEVVISQENRWRYDFLIGKMLIEYDGSYYHRTVEQIARDYNKYKLAKRHGYSLCRIREKDGIYLLMADITYEISSKDYGKRQRESIEKVLDNILEVMKDDDYAKYI